MSVNHAVFCELPDQLCNFTWIVAGRLGALVIANVASPEDPQKFGVIGDNDQNAANTCNHTMLNRSNDQQWMIGGAFFNQGVSAMEDALLAVSKQNTLTRGITVGKAVFAFAV